MTLLLYPYPNHGPLKLYVEGDITIARNQLTRKVELCVSPLESFRLERDEGLPYVYTSWLSLPPGTEIISEGK